MANYIFKESIPKIAEFFFLFFIFYLFLPFLLNLLWDMNEDFHFEVPKLNISSCVQLCIIIIIITKILYDFWVRIRPKEPKPKKTVIYISVIRPPKFLSVSFCSIFIYYFYSLRCFTCFFILFYKLLLMSMSISKD